MQSLICCFHICHHVILYIEFIGMQMCFTLETTHIAFFGHIFIISVCLSPRSAAYPQKQIGALWNEY